MLADQSKAQLPRVRADVARGWHSTTVCTPSCDCGQNFDQKNSIMVLHIFYNFIAEISLDLDQLDRDQLDRVY